MQITKNQYEKTTGELLEFIRRSPSRYHAADNLKQMYLRAGYAELKENERWEIERGGKYFVLRNGSAIIAFCIPDHFVPGFRITAAHSDAPTFKIKENPEIAFEDKYVKLNVEGYGGMIMSSWFDRPLSVAGRIAYLEDGEVKTKLADAGRDLLMIVNLAIHMNRDVNRGYVYNMQKDMEPLFGMITEKGSFMNVIAEAAEVRPEDILGHDLFLYNRMPGTIWGADDEFVSSPKLDDLQCAFSSASALLSSKDIKHIAVSAVFDNEEVGSGTRQGADSTFLYDTLKRINTALAGTEEDYQIHVADGLLLSADNGHAVHPNYPEKADPNNRPVMNGGPVLKFAGNQKYCTDAVSAAAFRAACKRADVPCQIYTNRSDVAGGSTLGNISTSHVSLSSADIGLAQLAMHSAYETGGVKDTAYMIEAMRAFYD